MSTVLVKSFSLREVDLKEVLRYAGVRGDSPSEETLRLAEECEKLCRGRIKSDVCFARLRFSVKDGKCEFPFGTYESESLIKNLAGCEEVIVFAATAGLELDRLIAGYGSTSPAKAHMLQSLGAERIESLCDSFCEYLKEEFGNTRPRFSPGYGDFPLEAQRDIFCFLDPPRRIGLSLNDSLLMSPTKSVTAVVGLVKK